MINRRVWRKSKRENMLPNGRLIESKWVCKNKIDVQFRARLVGRRYTQVPGVDFTENYSPVISDVKLCVILIM